MADKKKTGVKNVKNVKDAKSAKTAAGNKSALARGLEKSKNQRTAAIKSKPKNAPAQQERSGGLRDYFRGVRVETKKVVWPTRKELVSYTVVVFIACAFFGLFLWGVDSGLLAIIREVFNVNMN